VSWLQAAGFKLGSLGYCSVVAGEPTLQPRQVPRFLAIYLVDHHAGSAAGLDHARHLLSRSSGDAAGDVSRLVEEIVYDRVQLERLMQTLGVRPNPVKVALARAGAIVARLKPNGRVRSSPALSRLLEFETLLLGITGKQALWHALRQTPSVNGPGSLDFDELATRAADQAARVERLRLQVAGAALRNAPAHPQAST
jgi:hypothetical protein